MEFVVGRRGITVNRVVRALAYLKAEVGVCRWTSWGFLGISGWLGENSGLPVLLGKALVVPVVEFVVGRRGINVNRVG